MTRVSTIELAHALYAAYRAHRKEFENATDEDVPAWPQLASEKRLRFYNTADAMIHQYLVLHKEGFSDA